MEQQMTFSAYNTAVQTDLNTLRSLFRSSEPTRKALLASVAQARRGERFTVFGKTVSMRVAYRRAVLAMAASPARKPAPRHPQGVIRVERLQNAYRTMSERAYDDFTKQYGGEWAETTICTHVIYRPDITEAEARELLHHDEYELPQVEVVSDRLETDLAFDNRPTVVKGQYDPSRVKTMAELAADAPGQDFGHRDWAHNAASDAEVVSYDPIYKLRRGHLNTSSLYTDDYTFSDGTPVPFAERQLESLANELAFLSEERDSSKWANVFIDGELVARTRAWRVPEHEISRIVVPLRAPLGGYHYQSRSAYTGDEDGEKVGVTKLQTLIDTTNRETARRLALLGTDEAHAADFYRRDTATISSQYPEVLAVFRRLDQLEELVATCGSKAPQGLVVRLAKHRAYVERVPTAPDTFKPAPRKRYSVKPSVKQTAGSTAYDGILGTIGNLRNIKPAFVEPQYRVETAVSRTTRREVRREQLEAKAASVSKAPKGLIGSLAKARLGETTPAPVVSTLPLHTQDAPKGRVVNGPLPQPKTDTRKPRTEPVWTSTPREELN
jgi:hypothetical protein